MKPVTEVQQCGMAPTSPRVREYRSCTGNARGAMRATGFGSGLELDLDEDHLAGARVEHLVLDDRGPRIADAAREIREKLLAVSTHAQAAGDKRHDHVIEIMALRPRGGAQQQQL